MPAINWFLATVLLLTVCAIAIVLPFLPRWERSHGISQRAPQAEENGYYGP